MEGTMYSDLRDDNHASSEAKKTYEVPELIELGNVSDLTNTTEVSVQVSSLKRQEEHYEA
jgi:hypothetical protein